MIIIFARLSVYLSLDLTRLDDDHEATRTNKCSAAYLARSENNKEQRNEMKQNRNRNRNREREREREKRRFDLFFYIFSSARAITPSEAVTPNLILRAGAYI